VEYQLGIPEVLRVLVSGHSRTPGTPAACDPLEALPPNGWERFSLVRGYAALTSSAPLGPHGSSRGDQPEVLGGVAGGDDGVHLVTLGDANLRAEFGQSLEGQ